MDNITEEQEREAFEGLMAYEQEQENQRKAVMDIVKCSVSEEYYKELMEYIKECDLTHTFTIEDKPYGKPQYEGEILETVHVDQYVNGGYTGDTFAGSISIEFAKGRFLTFHYNM